MIGHMFNSPFHVTFVVWFWLKFLEIKKCVRSKCCLWQITKTKLLNTGADPGFRERGFLCMKKWRFALLFLNIVWKWNNLVSLKPNYFIFTGYLKTGGGEMVWIPDSGKGVLMYKSVGVSLCWFYHIFLKYLMKMKQFGLMLPSIDASTHQNFGFLPQIM